MHHFACEQMSLSINLEEFLLNRPQFLEEQTLMLIDKSNIIHDF